MKKRLEELAQGSFSCRTPELKVSEERLELKLPAGKQYRGSVSVGAEDGSKVKGMVVSDNHRILIANEKFSGNTCSLVFGIDTKGLRAGDKIEGSITILSNLAEKQIPVRAVLEEDPALAVPEDAEALDDFVKLCMKDLRAGFHLFTNPMFIRILNGKNRPFRALYKGLSHNPVTYQHMEEFLVAAGRKQPVRLSLDKQQKAVYTLEVSQKDTLYIYKSTWGYVRMEIQVYGDFLQIEKKVVTSDDFIGRVYGLEYIVDRNRLGKGKKYGRIRLKTVYQTLDFEIEASGEDGMRPLKTSFEKRGILKLTRDLLQLQLRKMDYRTWYEQSSQTVRELLEENHTAAFQLYQAYLAFCNDENTRVLELLWPMKEGTLPLESIREKAGYLYLAKQADLLPREKKEIGPELRKYYQQQPDDFLLLYFLLQDEQLCDTMPSRALYEMEAAFERGCTSPFLYLTAWRILERHETLLRRLSPFMIQVLRFVQREKILTAPLLDRAAYLSSHLKEFSAPVYELLTEGYRTFCQREVLEAICALLMKGNPIKKEYFPWYALAVEQEIRITRLYEYYMETVDGDSRRELPRQVKMYFVYNNTLGERKKAFLYASVIRHKEEDPASYESYRGAMEAFAEASLEKERIDENFAVLYQEFLMEPKTREQGAALCRVLFKRKLVCGDPKIRQVVVCHYALGEERVYPCQEGAAYVDLYSEDASILFEDGKKRRFASTVEYSLTQLLEEKEAAARCMDLGVEDTGLELYCCKEKAWQMEVNSRTLSCYGRAAENPEFTGEYRKQIRMKLLEYYYKHRDEPFLAPILKTLDIRRYAAADKGTMAEVLIDRGLYEQAFALVSEFGYERIPEQKLLRLASRMVLRKEFEEDEELLCLCSYVCAQGKYDEMILTYLRDYYLGTLESMCSLWKKVRGFNLESYTLDERILVLSMFVQGYPEPEAEILDSYARQRGSEKIIQAFLSYLSSGYFLEGRRTEKEIFRYLERIYEWGWEISEVCQLALLKHYSEQTAFTEQQERQARKLLKKFNDRGLRFGFYARFPAPWTQAYQVEDKIFVERHFAPGSQVVIHYQLRGEGQENARWVSEPLRDMFQGIFVKEFLLFYGETLTWYLTVTENGQTRDTAREQVSLTEVDTAGSTRYKLLNQMLAARKLGNRELMEKAARKFLWQDAYTSELFSLKK